MSKQHQYGILNCVEAGIMKENKFRRHREVDVRGSTFFGSANEIKLIYPPLRSRFLTLHMPNYTPEQFNQIGTQLLSRMNIDSILIEEIMQVIDTELQDKTIRDVVRLGTLVDTMEDITDLTALFKRHRLNFD
jgi:Holliday junction resolvasome RuvABC ATP-dependent DNA helicase subunit